MSTILTAHNQEIAVQPPCFPLPHSCAEQLQQIEGAKCWETILVVEDDKLIRDVACRILEMRGYAVLSAENANEGLRTFEEHEDAIQLVVTDMVMPGMNGREFVHRLTERSPGLKAIFISGYDGVTLCAGFESNVTYLQKPFTLDELARKVREVMDGVAYPAEGVHVN